MYSDNNILDDYDNNIACSNLSLLLFLPLLPYCTISLLLCCSSFSFFTFVISSYFPSSDCQALATAQRIYAYQLKVTSHCHCLQSRWIEHIPSFLFFSFSLLHYALVFSSWLCLSSCRVLITLFSLLLLIHKHTHTYSFFSLRYGYLLLSVSFSSYLTNMLSSI